jgi:hypothetical protein
MGEEVPVHRRADHRILTHGDRLFPAFQQMPSKSDCGHRRREQVSITCCKIFLAPHGGGFALTSETCFRSRISSKDH